MSEDSDTEVFGRLVADLRSSDLHVRIEAAKELGRLRDRRAVAPLIDALDDVEWRGSLAAVQALGEIDDDRAVEPIVEVMRRIVIDTALFERAVEFPRSATKALKHLGEAGFQQLLKLAAEFSESEFPGEAIFVTLGETHDLRTLDTLLFALHSSVYEVQDAAARALTTFGEQAISPLIVVLREPHARQHYHARFALQKLGHQAIPLLLDTFKNADETDLRADIIDVLGAYDDERAREALRQALADREEDVRIEAAFALGERGDPRAIEQILVRPQRNSGSNMSAMTLAQIGEPAVEPLIAALNDPQRPAHARVNAAIALGSIGDTRAFDALLAAMRASDPNIARVATRALGDLHDIRAVEPLLAALDHGEDTVRAGIIEALGILADERAFEITFAAASDPNESPKVRKAAILALGPGYGDRALPVLRDILVSDEGFAKHLAFMAITRHEANATPILIELATTAPWEHASKAMVALQHMIYHERDDRIIDFLVTALRHPDLRIRQQAALTLGQVGDARAVDSLIECLSDPHFTTRFNAAQILSQIGDERAIPALERALADSIATHPEQSGWGGEHLREAFQSAILAIRARQDSVEQASHGT